MAEAEKSESLFVILVAPNISEQMGGEAIKALQLYQELNRLGVRLHQVTHERVRREIEAKFPDMPVTYVVDDWLQRFAWRSVVLRPLVGIIFSRRAGKLAREIARGHEGAVVHFNTPVSPVRPYFKVRGVPVVIGPLNGNIHYPPGLRHWEPWSDKLRRLGHPIAQRALKFFFRGKQTARSLLVAGGQRTYQSLRMAGCRQEQFVDSLDSGIPDHLADVPRIEHSGKNLRFVQNGRIVKHKGAGLVIRALARTRNPVEFDVIGRGPERENLIALTRQLGLENRVHFLDWIKDHAQVSQTLRAYRAYVFPSMAEANGIVVQEAMYQGLPVICLKWGGPALLVTDECGIAVEPRAEAQVVDELAVAMDRLAEDGDLAERMSRAGRARARDYLWSNVAAHWLEVYRCVRDGRKPPDVAEFSRSREPRTK